MLTRKKPLSQEQLAEKLRMEKLQRAETLRQEEVAGIRREQERRRRWAETESPEARRAAGEREQAERQEAERNERDRKIRENENRRALEWKAERDRLTAELAEARNAVSLLGAGNSTDAIPLELAEKLRVRVWLMAAEQIVEETEAALAKHQAQNGTRGR